MKPGIKFFSSHGAVPATASAALNSIQDPARPVLEEVGDVADSIAVGQEVPAAGAVAVVVEPGAEDEVGRRAEEDAAIGLADALVSRKNYFDNTHMMTSHVKNPQ